MIHCTCLPVYVYTSCSYASACTRAVCAVLRACTHATYGTRHTNMCTVIAHMLIHQYTVPGGVAEARVVSTWTYQQHYCSMMQRIATGGIDMHITHIHTYRSVPPPPMFSLSVQALSGHVYQVPVTHTTTVREVKRSIRKIDQDWKVGDDVCCVHVCVQCCAVLCSAHNMCHVC